MLLPEYGGFVPRQLRDMKGWLGEMIVNRRVHASRDQDYVEPGLWLIPPPAPGGTSQGEALHATQDRGGWGRGGGGGGGGGGGKDDAIKKIKIRVSHMFTL